MSGAEFGNGMVEKGGMSRGYSAPAACLPSISLSCLDRLRLVYRRFIFDVT
jgi:hypothetical protein